MAYIIKTVFKANNCEYRNIQKDQTNNKLEMVYKSNSKTHLQAVKYNTPLKTTPLRTASH